MKSVPQEYEARPVADLVLHPRNPNQGDVGAITTSLERTGWYGAVVVQKSTGYILAGNHRVKAASAQGADTVPCLVVDVDDETATRIMLADNRMAALAQSDDDQLVTLLQELQEGGGLLGTGFDEDDLDALLNEWATDLLPGADVPEPPTQPGVLRVVFEEVDRDEVREAVQNALDGIEGARIA